MPRGIPNSRLAEADQLAEAAVPEQALSPRAHEERTERRRRDDGDLDRMARMKLAIPREVREELERNGLEPRWIKDDPGRLQQAHDDDWDVVSGVRPVSADRETDTKLVLHAKRKDWFEADRARKLSPIDEMEKAIERGQVDGSGKAVATEQNARLARSNRITRG